MRLSTEDFNFISAVKPMSTCAAVTTTFPCQPVKLGRYDSMVAIVSLYDNSTEVLWVDEYKSLTPTGAGTLGTTGNYLPIGTAYYRIAATTAPIDTLGTRTSFPSTGVTITSASTTRTTFLIEIKGDDLDADYPYVAIAISTSATCATVGAVDYILKPRYPGKTMPTALS